MWQAFGSAGYASIEYRPEDDTRPDVHGVVLDLTQEEMKSLAAIETGYDMRKVIVTGADGNQYAAKAFMSNWSVRLFNETLPTQDYIGKLQEGAQVHDLPADYQVQSCVLQHNNAQILILLPMPRCEQAPCVLPQALTAVIL